MYFLTIEDEPLCTEIMKTQNIAQFRILKAPDPSDVTLNYVVISSFTYFFCLQCMSLASLSVFAVCLFSPLCC